MKRIFIIIIFILFTICSVDLYAAVSEFNGKIGTSYAKEPKKYGLDISLNYFYVLDPFFAAGFEGGFFWLKWDRKLDTKEIGLTSADVKAKTDSYILPFLFNFHVRLPNVAESIKLEPSLIVGLGYSIMFLDDSIPDYVDSGGTTHKARDDVDFYHGFAWQTIVSFALRPAPSSDVKFTFDFGYRGLKPERNGIEFNMSGIILRGGVKFEI